MRGERGKRGESRARVSKREKNPMVKF